MSNYINQFKEDFFSGVFSLSKKTWLKITYAYTIYYVAALIVGLIFAAIALLGVIDTDFFSDILSNPDPEHSLLLIQQISDMILTPEFIFTFLVVFVILIILASWNYYIAFIATDAEINDKHPSFSELLKQSISIEVFKLAGITLLLNIAITSLFAIAALSMSMNIFLGILLFISACVVAMRFILVIPAFIIGNYDINSAFAYSFHHITRSRAIKYFGVSILAMLLIMGVSLMIGLFSTVFSLIPLIGPIMQIAINVALGAVMMTIIVAALTGLFYRYANSSPLNKPAIPDE